MDTALPSERLTIEHHQIDQGVEGIVNGTGEPQALMAALKLLRQYVYVEEQVLFPPLAETGLAMPIFVMNREHGLMWPLIRSLEAACAAAAAADTLREDARNFMQLLTIHNVKEEEVVYAAADRYANAHPDTSLTHTSITQAIAAARMPEDWICAKEPH